MEGMNMDHGHGAAEATATGAAKMTNPMSMTIFSSSIDTTFLSPEWTTSSPAAYAGTLLFLIILAIFHRFLSAIKSQLEIKWVADTARRRIIVRGVTRSSSPFGATPLLMDADDDERQPRSSEERNNKPDERIMDEAQKAVESGPGASEETETHAAARRRFWTPRGPWRWSVDGVRGVLEFVRSALGYILMLAVMSFNVGFFFAVLCGILLGELAFGRY